MLPASKPSIWLIPPQGMLYLLVEQSFCQDGCALDTWNILLCKIYLKIIVTTTLSSIIKQVCGKHLFCNRPYILISRHFDLKHLNSQQNLYNHLDRVLGRDIYHKLVISLNIMEENHKEEHYKSNDVDEYDQLDIWYHHILSLYTYQIWIRNENLF